MEFIEGILGIVRKKREGIEIQACFLPSLPSPRPSPPGLSPGDNAALVKSQSSGEV